MPDPPDIIHQAAVIPHRTNPTSGSLEVALITNRSGDAWILPKGIVDPGEVARESAARECVEEAGLIGEISDEPVGSYSYEKWGAICEVEVFLLRVTNELETWDEDVIRTRKWFRAMDAANAVREAEVAEMIRAL